jgi:hypothetical protein
MRSQAPIRRQKGKEKGQRFPPALLFLACELLVLEALWFKRIRTKTTLFVFFVVFEVALEPFDMRVTFEGKDVRTNPVKEETVVRNDHGATGKFGQRIL